MDMVLKVATTTRSARDDDWRYYSGFDTVESETYWFAFTKEPAKSDDEVPGGRIALLAYRCKAPEREEFELPWSEVENIIAPHCLKQLQNNDGSPVPVRMIKLLKCVGPGKYDVKAQIACNTSAYLLGPDGQTVDRI